MNSTKKGSYNSASTEEYTIRPNPADNSSSFAERAFAEFKEKFVEYRDDYLPHLKQYKESNTTSVEEAIDFFLIKLAEAEQHGRDSAVDYIKHEAEYHPNGHEDRDADYYTFDAGQLNAARHLTTPS